MNPIAVTFLTLYIFETEIHCYHRLEGGLKSCKDNDGICTRICQKSLINNPLATGNSQNRPDPKCDSDGACHCYVEQAPGTWDKFRPPVIGTGEESCTCVDSTSSQFPESPLIYEDKKNQLKYCVCFSGLRTRK